MNPKMLAKKQALMNMSKKLKEDTRSPMKEELSSKKKMKVIVEAPDEESLSKGLSKAEELLKAKFGELGLDEDSMEEAEEEYEDCDVCKNEGCPMCYEESPELEEEAEEIVE